MKKIILITLFGFISLLLISCSNTGGAFPKVESSGYDISVALEPLNNYLESGTIYDSREVRDNIIDYLRQYDLVSNEASIIVRNNTSLDVYGDQESDKVIDIQVTISDIPESFTGDIFEKMELMFLQIRQDIDQNTTYPYSFYIEIGVENGFARFSAKEGLENSDDGLFKRVYIRYEHIDFEDFDESLMDVFFKEEYEKFYNIRVGFRATFSDLSFGVEKFPMDKTYYIRNNPEGISKEEVLEFMNSYIGDFAETTNEPY